MVRRRGSRGFTLLEVSVTLAIFGIFIYIITVLTAEMRAHEKQLPINFLAHPEVNAVMARLRRDVLDTKYYPLELAGYSQTPQTLILATIRNDGTIESVIYDFRTKGEVHRRSFLGTQQQTDWVARGVPAFIYTAYDHGDQTGVRIIAFDDSDKKKGPQLAIDEIFIPRPHS